MKIRELRLSDIKEPARDSLAKNWWKSDTNPSLIPKPKFFLFVCFAVGSGGCLFLMTIIVLSTDQAFVSWNLHDVLQMVILGRKITKTTILITSHAKVAYYQHNL